MVFVLSEPLTIERLTVEIADLPLSISGSKIVQLSDFHYDGERLDDNLLTEAIERANQENPDLVALTGDFVTHNPNPIHKLAANLKHLRSRLGTHVCLGNHDIVLAHSRTEITSALTKIGATVLWNEIAFPFGESFPVVGLADFWSKEFKPEFVFNQIANNIPRLVLSHNPDTAAIFQRKGYRVDLQLSGHTHGGQVNLPGIGPIPSLVRQISDKIPQISGLLGLRDTAYVVKHWEWARGWHQVGRNQLYVNRGLGTYAPGRLFCPPELTVITLLSTNG